MKIGEKWSMVILKQRTNQSTPFGVEAKSVEIKDQSERPVQVHSKSSEMKDDQSEWPMLVLRYF